MTQAEKFEALVQRAINNGWTWQTFQGRYFPDYLGERTANHIAITMNDMRLNCLLFNHVFARALFGEQDAHDSDKPWNSKYLIHGACDGDCYGGAHFSGPVFEYHLMHAVISKDPIDYMYKVVFGD